MEPIEIAFELFNGNQTLKRKVGDVEIVVDKPCCDGNICFPMHVCVRCPNGIMYNQFFSIPFHKRKYSEEHITPPFDPKKEDALLRINVTRHFSRITITIAETGKEKENYDI